MAKKNGRKISFNLNTFKAISFTINEKKTNLDEGELGFKYYVNAELDTSKSQITISFIISVQEGKDAAEPISKLETKTVFNVSNVNQFVGEKGEWKVPDNLAITLLSIAHSTTRGAMAVKTENSFLKDYPIPLINPEEMYNVFKDQLG